MLKGWSRLICIAGTFAMLIAGSGQVMAAEIGNLRTERVNKNVSVPANIAFTSHQNLYLLDGRNQNEAPKEITKNGFAEIVDWSADGKWLLYLQFKGNDNYSTPGYLWAVRSDGSGVIQVDERPVMQKPKWSPKANTFAYTINIGSNEVPTTQIVLKTISDRGELTLQSKATANIVDFTWMPDGEKLLVSTPAEKNRAMTLELRSLAGKTLATYPMAKPPKVEEGIYPWAPEGMTVSPDATRVAFFVRYNSGSLSADGVPIQLFNLTQPNQLPTVLGTGLAYPDWLAWSPDSKYLAFIEGADRIATMNKHLNLADREGKVVPASHKEWVDTLPVWTRKEQEALYFSRGKGTEYHYDPKKVMMPGQRIWKQAETGEQKQVTQGTEQTADYYPTPSLDGTQLLFMRMNEAESGSLFLKQGDKEVELITGITGDGGYYANYLPPWIRVYWNC
ncbi:hypothetical protein J31TS6_25060 [Brevibacillus reuszeri]|uniref:TolB family protein n=1 Tax=Brevibacillus reuszeri TaxID=54915 RepID=UPI001B2DAFB5|nr:hypothetical protein [Brevibacillus reuszeri]GIO06478.1 hypothetical protein J31TS6_25060 [Brevibacillus reuszeri]